MPTVDLLTEALEAHGIACRAEAGVVRLANSELVLAPRVFDGPANESSKLVQLDLLAYSSRIAPRFVVESIAGFGSDRSAAENNAFGKFLLGSFHVLLTALADHSCDANPAEWLRWQGVTDYWRVCDGPLLTQGPQVATDLYSAFMEQLRELFVSTVSSQPHWVRVYVGSFDRKIAGLDVLLDNELWPEATALARQWDWRCPEEYRSLRHFFMAFPGAR